MAGIRNPRVGPLDSLQAVRRELARVYRKARQGEIPVEDLRAYVYALKTLSDILNDTVIEQRLDALETHGARSCAPSFPRRAA